MIGVNSLSVQTFHISEHIQPLFSVLLLKVAVMKDEFRKFPTFENDKCHLSKCGAASFELISDIFPIYLVQSIYIFVKNIITMPNKYP